VTGRKTTRGHSAPHDRPSRGFNRSEGPPLSAISNDRQCVTPHVSFDAWNVALHTPGNGGQGASFLSDQNSKGK